MRVSAESHWLRIAQLAGLGEPFSENEMARLSEMVDTRKRSSFGNEKKKKVKVDEMGEYIYHGLILFIRIRFKSCEPVSAILLWSSKKNQVFFPE